jgi:hypothetical protein
MSGSCTLTYPTKKLRHCSASLDHIIDGARFPFSPRVLTLKAIRSKLRPEPAREPLPPPKHYEPPRVGRRRRR